MTRSAAGVGDAAETVAGESELSPADPGSDERSQRTPERASERVVEPGFFEQIVQMLKPRAAAPLRDRVAAALGKAEPGEAGFAPDELRMLTNLLGMQEMRVEDAMVARSEIEGVDIGATLGELMRRFEETGHSRMPVYGDGLDDLRGMVHIRDAMAHLTRAALAGSTEGGVNLGAVDLGVTIAELDLVRKVLFVPPSMPAAELMARMQATRIQMALVIDEYGGTDGLVSLEDLIEIIVGDIEDEHDTDDGLIVAAGEGVFDLDARAELRDVQRAVGEDFDIAAHEAEADTIGGLVVTELGRIPEQGEAVETLAGFRIEIVEADARRVKRVRLVRVDHPSPPVLN